MAQKVTRKVTRAAKQAPAPAAAANGTRAARRTRAEVDLLVPDFVKHLTAGGKMRELKAKHGFTDDGPIRAALLRGGYDSKGQPVDVESITLKGVKLADRLVKERNDGTPWYQLELATGLSQGELKKIVAERGGSASGRVYRAPAEKPAKAKTGATAKRTITRKATKADPSSQA